MIRALACCSQLIRWVSGRLHAQFRTSRTAQWAVRASSGLFEHGAGAESSPYVTDCSHCAEEEAEVKPLNIVLVEPEIPQNTGNVARTCACTGSVLHLVEPMGFRLTQRNLQRAGCDYWDDVEIVQWPCADAFFEAHGGDELHLFTGHVSRNYTDAAYGEGTFLLFGRESRGLDEAFIQRYLDACVRIPMCENERSLNLSNAVAIAAYEALRQQSWPNMN